MKVICKATRGYKLKKNKTYNVLEETDSRYLVTNEAGLDRNYSKKLFEVVKENLTLEQILESVCLVENEVQFKTRDNNDVILEVNDFITLEDSQVSCGVKQLVGINSLVEVIVKTVNEEYSSSYFNQSQRNQIIVTVLKKAVECAAELDIQQYKFLLISTTTGNNSNSERNDNYSLLGEAFSLRGEAMQLVGNNPNTNNEISLWVLDVEQAFKD